MAKLDRNPTRYKRHSSTSLATTANTNVDLAGVLNATRTGAVEWIVGTELGDYPIVIQRMEVFGFLFPIAGDVTTTGELFWQHVDEAVGTTNLTDSEDVEDALQLGLNEIGGITKPIWKIFFDKLTGHRGMKMAVHNVVLAEEEELRLVLRPDQTDTGVARYLRGFVKSRRY